ncbi:MAG: LytTR family DNA-binding domain-containing protein [Oscillospiraceae bacterium]|jgi:two-component system LytT family response regulator|nr:LytTR family DNA-binding domain-containing protein [Oscillospiraceae bacterium]
MNETPIPVVIADDEPGMRLVMQKVLRSLPDFALAAEAADGPCLVDAVERLRPRLVFLDVEMPGMDGVECARLIQDIDPSILLIFATAHAEYMAQAFEVYAFDYLLKPFKLERVQQTLSRARDMLRLREAGDSAARPLPAAPPPKPLGRLMLHHREGVQFLNMQDILLVQREDRATVLYTAQGGRYVTSDTLGDIEARLDATLFFRCHKSYIINLQHVDNITPYGRWTYIVRLRGTQHDALITHERYADLEKRFA